MSLKDIDKAEASLNHVMDWIMIRSPVELRLRGLTPEQRLVGLTPEQLAAAIPPEVLAVLSEKAKH